MYGTIVGTCPRRRGEQGIRGWRSFTSVPVGDVSVVIEIGGARIEVLADRGGVVDTRIPVALTPGWHEARLHTEGSVVAEAPIRIVGPDVDFGIISDVDDTVMVTALPRPLLAFWNTFVLDEHARIPTPGMAVLFERLARAHPGSPVIYLSTGAPSPGVRRARPSRAWGFGRARRARTCSRRRATAVAER